MNPVSRREIEDAVREALSRRGVTATVDVREGFVEATAEGRPAAADMGSLGDDWPRMPPGMRTSAADAIATKLIETARAPRPASRPVARRGGSPVPVTAIVVVALVGLIGIVAVFGIARKWVASSLGPAPSTSASETVPRESDAETSARRARVCEATRKRVYAGASVGPLDVDGWVAELWLAKRGDVNLANAPALKAFVAGDKITPGADAEIAKVQDGKVELVDATGPELGKAWHAAVLRFSGRYVDGYLDASGRARFEALAERVYTASGADLGALYGRCAHLSTHELGAWFIGPDAPSASAALLASIGLSTDIAAVDRKKLGGEPLDALQKAGKGLDATELASSVGASGGNVAPGASAVVVTFPLGGPIRASGASRALARRLHVENSYSPAE